MFYLESLLEGVETLWLDPKMIIMWIIAFSLLYFGISKKKEPLLLIPISFGILLANLPLGELIKEGSQGEASGILRFFQKYGLETDVLPLLVFLGLGALTDFSPAISNPKTLILGAGAQAGVFRTLRGSSGSNGSV